MMKRLTPKSFNTYCDDADARQPPDLNVPCMAAAPRHCRPWRPDPLLKMQITSILRSRSRVPYDRARDAGSTSPVQIE